MATYVHNRMPTRAPGGVTPYEAHYGTKLKVEHLCTFRAPCVIVEPQHKLKKLDDRASMCFFVGYKYSGGGYWVWDLKRQVVIKSRDIVFFKISLPLPTLCTLNKLANNANICEQQPLEPSLEPAASTPAPAPAPAPVQPTVVPSKASLHEAMLTPASVSQPMVTQPPQERLFIQLPRCLRSPLLMQPTPNDVNESESDEALPQQPTHDVSHVPDYPMRTLHSGLRCDVPEGGSTSTGCNRGGGASAMLVIDDDAPPVAFSVGLPGRIQLLQLPDPQNVHEAMAAPDADGWRDAMDREMKNLKSHDVYKLVLHMPSMGTLRLGWVLHCKFKNSIFNKNKACLVARGNQQLSDPCPTQRDRGKPMAECWHGQNGLVVGILQTCTPSSVLS